jgi:hypothetical protein
VRLLSWAVAGALWARQTSVGDRVVDSAVATAREKVAIGTLPYLLHHVARYRATTDQWSLALADYHEAVRLARETEQRTDLAAALAGLAWLEARQGNEACRGHAAEARRLCAELGAGVYELWSIAAMADLELGRGAVMEALFHLTEYERVLTALGVADADLSPAPELVEVYLRLGRPKDALAAAQEFDRQATAKGQPWALARAARCRALLSPDNDCEEYFLDAQDLHRLTPDVFEAARTQLAYGSRLRRTRQRIRSRTQLRKALDQFDALGATPWAMQASAELAATGETARRRDANALDQLTPQVLQIALLLADGQTTREAASVSTHHMVDLGGHNKNRRPVLTGGTIALL